MRLLKVDWHSAGMKTVILIGAALPVWRMFAAPPAAPPVAPPVAPTPAAPARGKGKDFVKPKP